MPVQLSEEDDGKVLIVDVSGRLTQSDYADLSPAFDRLVRRHGKLKVLFEMSGFHGWDAGAAWEDLKLGVAHFADIERLALVGEKKWQEGLAVFSRPFTKAAIRYFDHADAAEARRWVGEE
ncbi:MAG: STAS/SEC14 domain-containing protein [Candidatus Eisenbacteria bacterium]